MNPRTPERRDARNEAEPPSVAQADVGQARVGPPVDQRRLRPARPFETLDPYLRFLDEIDELFGVHAARRRPPAPPGRFRL